MKKFIISRRYVGLQTFSVQADNEDKAMDIYNTDLADCKTDETLSETYLKCEEEK